jgi:nucleotide-binding universal stress UspA family protein
MTTILLGLDGSPGATAAVDWVARHGPALDARVSAVLVVPRVEVWEMAAVQIDSGPIIAQRRGLLQTEWTEPLRAAGLRTTTRVLRGDPATELCKLAESRDVDLLVVGAKSHTALHNLLGGTAHKIVNHCRVPVLLVPTPSTHATRTPGRARPNRR